MCGHDGYMEEWKDGWEHTKGSGDATPPFSAPGSVGCPGGWLDQPNTIQVNWTAPQRPNGFVLQSYLVLTNFDSNTVIASTTVNSNAALTTDFTARLGELYVIDYAFLSPHVPVFHAQANLIQPWQHSICHPPSKNPTHATKLRVNMTFQVGSSNYRGLAQLHLDIVCPNSWLIVAYEVVYRMFCYAVELRHAFTIVVEYLIVGKLG